MKLRNKKTGEIKNLMLVTVNGYAGNDTLAKINEDWEDYEEPKEYWYIAELCGGLQRKQDTDNGEDRFNKQIGNYFETEEEADKVVEKLKAWKRLKDRGFRFTGYNSCSVDYDIDKQYRKYISDDLNILFGGEE